MSETTGTRDFKLASGAPGTLTLSGVLSFDTAANALQELRAAVARDGIKQLDLAGIRRSDSAGLSCIVAVMAESAQGRRPLQVVNMPVGLQALAQVCGVDGLIG
ncbi:STAS domain-containing protein [Rhodanobacter sp. L36]|uniref:STAS domain-containing protein n=1 Tax=Rhodanobacter sp. L36 TaxID=1747221 RepID=UPI00131D8416|nr:STAS domain-containing protein [Rhodanobacter sp. L36]